MPINEKGKKVVNITSCGITWVDLRIVFGLESKYAGMWLGVCHYDDRVYMWTPLDYERPLMITSIEISPTEDYCECAKECINFKCPMNRFNKQVFISKFKDLGKESLGLPNNFGDVDLWFNDPNEKWYHFWAKILELQDTKPEGGKIEFSPQKWEDYSSGKFV